MGRLSALCCAHISTPLSSLGLSSPWANNTYNIYQYNIVVVSLYYQRIMFYQYSVGYNIVVVSLYYQCIMFYQYSVGYNIIVLSLYYQRIIFYQYSVVSCNLHTLKVTIRVVFNDQISINEPYKCWFLFTLIKFQVRHWRLCKNTYSSYSCQRKTRFFQIFYIS